VRRAASFPLLPAFAFAALALLAGCSKEPSTLAGGWTDTETGPKVTGVIQREDGAPAAGALVLLRPADYLARNPDRPDSQGSAASGGSVLDAMCDSTGAFQFDSVGIGDYYLESRDREIKAVAIRFRVDKAKGRFTLPAATVRSVGSVTGRVRFQDGNSGRVLVRIFGLERAATTDPSGAYFFGNVPAGNYNLHFSGLDPFIQSATRADVRVVSNANTDAGDIGLQRDLKQGFRITDGSVEIPGVDSANPVILENGTFQNMVDGAYLWAKASMGHLDLRGTVVSYGADTGVEALKTNMANCERAVRVARNSGMRGIPGPVAGARRPLIRSPGGRLESIKSDASEGAMLILSEARKASAERPLVVISGANLTTAAEALLLDPSIADRMIVLGANNGNHNIADTLAMALLVKKARFVEWARNYVWNGAGLNERTPDVFPGNRLGQVLRTQFGTDIHGLKSFAFYGDFGAATFLFQRKVWSAAAGMDLLAPPFIAQAASGPVFDFVDIPRAANDWNAIQDEFFSAITSPEAYHPWPLPGKVEAEAYVSALDAGVDSSGEAGGEACQWKASGSLAEYAIEVGAAGMHTLEFRYRAAGPSGLKVFSGFTGDTVTVDLPAAADWATVKADIPLEAGAGTLRLENALGAFDLDWWRAAPR
jgi:hypothetical protein